MEVKINTAYKKLSETVVHTGAWTFAFGKNIDKKSQRWVTGIDSVYKLNESLSGRGSSADTVAKVATI